MIINNHIKKKLVIKSKTENLSTIREFVSENANDAGLSKEEIDDIILAVDEACTNIIKHAYKSFPDGEIIIAIDNSNQSSVGDLLLKFYSLFKSKLFRKVVNDYIGEKN